MPVNTMVLKVFMLKNSVILYQIEQFSAKKPVDVRDKMKNIAECSKIKPWQEISCLRSTAFLCILDWFWTENRVISLLDTDEISWNTLPMRNWHISSPLLFAFALSRNTLPMRNWHSVCACSSIFVKRNTLPMRNWHVRNQIFQLHHLYRWKYITYEELTQVVNWASDDKCLEIHYLWGIDTFIFASFGVDSAEIHYLWGIDTYGNSRLNKLNLEIHYLWKTGIFIRSI